MSRAILFDIQHYAVHDGPGIRTLVFLKGCPLRCAWCSNPESHHRTQELRHVRARCKGCGRCAAACPSSAIVPGPDGRPVIDRGVCAQCARRDCLGACPEGALEAVGFEAGVEEVIARVAADADFYRNSGGGVTFSGGEPFSQPDFLIEALGRCRDLGIRTAVSTAGLADPLALAAAEPLVDLFLFDVKIIDPRRHRRHTGAGNETILENLRALTGRVREKIRVRVPIVPGFTDGEENLDSISGLLAECGLGAVTLQPYHGLGVPKYADLGYPPPPAIEPPGREAMNRAARRFAFRGIACRVG